MLLHHERRFESQCEAIKGKSLESETHMHKNNDDVMPKVRPP